MAQLSPSLPTQRKDAGLARELDVLEHLQQCLPDNFEIFHSVSWHTFYLGSDHHGEIDLVILSPTGNMLLMEVKAGGVVLRNGDVFKLYQGREHDVARQTRVQYSAMVSSLSEASLHAQVTNCLVLPDYHLGETPVVAIPRSRIIDASDYPLLGTRVREMLDSGHSKSDVASIRRFLANEFRVSADLQVLGEQVRRSSQRLADGLATWVPRIVSPSGAVRIQATAGSGKTQLALRLLGDAAAKGQHSLYVCFNRSLADHMGRIAPPGAKVTSFHELCVEYHARNHSAPDFDRPEMFQILTETYCAASSAQTPRYDLIIIDEGQDFEPDWVASLLPQLAEDARLYVMEDNAQRLYERDGFDLDGAVTLNCHDNFRSPRVICQVINALRLSDHPVEGRSPYEGELPGFRTYADERDLPTRTEEAVLDLMARGIPLAEIVVLSGRGRAKSILQNADCLGGFVLKRFTGHYTPDGTPRWTEGDLLVDSIYRFKGQSAGGVVLSELDFDALTDIERRKLFVGLTRAHLAVEMVLSPRAEACLAKALG
ncbi:nuclease-related domain-containing DEAD/DEAH box helicase [Zoogloea sp.]|uniref:nuclease-related domain-containing DEAD/DEAH box helicase n=1 Tax=Zoogloea sp. TaxID=49181 RepID=UPI00262BBEA7|nr:nuclease-related domain-containing DEAD/DEAH box helicase [Zoogloea sp.]